MLPLQYLSTELILRPINALEPIAPMLTNMAVNIGFILAVWTHIRTITFAWEVQPISPTRRAQHKVVF